MNHNQLVKALIQSISSIIPVPLKATSIRPIQGETKLKNYSVIIGVVGSLKGNLVLQADKECIQEVSTAMYGMSLEGDMLKSFFGEIGNMVGGNYATSLVAEGLVMDIAPPNIIEGESSLSGLSVPYEITFLINEKYEMKVLLNLQ